VLEVDGKTVSQSNAINRYVGKLADLYPSDPWQAALCDEVMEAVEDIGTKIGATFALPEEQKKAQREELVAGPIPFYLTRLEQRLEAHGGRYFAADRLTVADLKVFVRIRRLIWPIASRLSWLSTMNGLRATLASRPTTQRTVLVT